MKRAVCLMLLLACCLLYGCQRQEPVLNPDITLPPKEQEVVDTPVPTEEPTPVPTPEEEQDYWQYLSFKNIVVYEQDQSTFVDATIVSTYDGVLVVVLDIEWSDKNGVVGVARLTDGTGQEVLYLNKGENRVYGTALTDMNIEALEFSINSVGGDPVPLQ